MIVTLTLSKNFLIHHMGHANRQSSGFGWHCSRVISCHPLSYHGSLFSGVVRWELHQERRLLSVRLAPGCTWRRWSVCWRRARTLRGFDIFFPLLLRIFRYGSLHLFQLGRSVAYLAFFYFFRNLHVKRKFGRSFPPYASHHRTLLAWGRLGWTWSDFFSWVIKIWRDVLSCRVHYDWL